MSASTQGAAPTAPLQKAAQTPLEFPAESAVPEGLEPVTMDQPPTNRIQEQAAQMLAQLEAQLGAQTAAIRGTASQTRAAVQQLYAQAKAQALQRIQAANATLTGLVQQKQQSALSIEEQHSAQLTSEGEANRTQITVQEEQGHQSATSLKEEKTQEAQDQLEAGAETAQEEGQSRAGEQEGGILGQLKSQAAVALGTDLAQTILDGISGVVDTITGFIKDVAQSIHDQISQILELVGNAIQSTLGLLPQLTQSVLEQLGVVQGKMESSLTQVGQQISAKLDESEANVMLAIEGGEADAVQQLQIAYAQGATFIAELGAAAVDEDCVDCQDANEEITANNDALLAQLEQIYADSVGAFADITDGFAQHMNLQQSAAQTDVSQVLEKLNAELEAAQSSIVSKLDEGEATLGSTMQQIIGQALGFLSSVVAQSQAGVENTLQDAQTQSSDAVEQAADAADTQAKSPAAYSTAESRTESWYETASKQVMSSLTDAASSVLNLKRIQRAEDETSFWSGVKEEALDFGKSILALFATALGAVILAALLGPFAPLVGLAVVGLLIYGLAQPFIDVWNRMEEAGLPLWLRIILVPFIGVAELVGFLPLLEGMVGVDLITGRELTNEERGRRITRGIIDIVLTFGTAGIGRLLKGVVKGVRWLPTGVRRAGRAIAEAFEEISKAFRRKGKAPQGAPGEPPKGGKGNAGDKEPAVGPDDVKVKIPADLALACVIGSLNCRFIPDGLLDEVEPYPNLHDIPFPTGLFQIQKSALTGVARDTAVLREIARANRSQWPHFDKALKQAEKAGLDWPVDKFGNPWQVHHIKPVSFGGGNSPGNLVPLAPGEHSIFTNWWNALHRQFRIRFTKTEWDKIHSNVKDVPGSKTPKEPVR